MFIYFRSDFFTDRNSTWPHPAYREGAPPNERPMHMDQQSQHIPSNTAWDMNTPTTLPPPPSIPLSLNLSAQDTNLSRANLRPQLPRSLQALLPNMTMPPPSWNPLPPPPMFTGDAQNRQAMGQSEYYFIVTS